MTKEHAARCSEEWWIAGTLRVRVRLFSRRSSEIAERSGNVARGASSTINTTGSG